MRKVVKIWPVVLVIIGIVFLYQIAEAREIERRIQRARDPKPVTVLSIDSIPIKSEGMHCKTVIIERVWNCPTGKVCGSMTVECLVL